MEAVFVDAISVMNSSDSILASIFHFLQLGD